jgi:restriction endonuclease Mrr
MKVLDNLDTEYLMVQCKHWKTPIPPNEMRAFKTACDEEHSNYKKVKMFITSSRFSPSAKELANKHNIIMVDGDNLISRKESNGS